MRLTSSYYPVIVAFSFAMLVWQCTNHEKIIKANKWDKVVLDFEGPELNEEGDDNPFTDYRMEVTFSNRHKEVVIPGFFAADGKAAETGASKGNVWRVIFRSDEEGTWTYQVSFRKGKNISTDPDSQAGEPLGFDGSTGSLTVYSANAQRPDLRSKGRLLATDNRYFQFAETSEYFLKGGADSPENLLGYEDFDGTVKGSSAEQREGEAENKQALHRYEPHLGDWREGDPTWKNGKGKGLIGALNYLASKGMNSMYFLTLNIGGDGKDVWPYTSYDERYRFDCSKLDQWEIVFDHAERLGIALHVVTQETENERLLDDGDTGPQRRLYYRELIARFGHHLAVVWNLGEENGPADFSPHGQTLRQQRTMIEYLKKTDPYKNPSVLHTHASETYRYPILDSLLGDKSLDGPSLQLGNFRTTHVETLHWTHASKQSGKPWAVCIDEIGPHWRGVDPDDRIDNNQDTVRREVLWGSLMAGGAGAEWYFGYKNHNNDLGCEDWRSRDRMWEYTQHAIAFFQTYVPFYEMNAADSLVSKNAWCLANANETYLVYAPYGGDVTIHLAGEKIKYRVRWFDPAKGGELQQHPAGGIYGGATVTLKHPTPEVTDWAALLTRVP